MPLSGSFRTAIVGFVFVFQLYWCTSFPIRRTFAYHVTDVQSDANMAATVAPEHFNNLQLLLKVTTGIQNA